jgi:hypothetical protein
MGPKWLTIAPCCRELSSEARGRKEERDVAVADYQISTMGVSERERDMKKTVLKWLQLDCPNRTSVSKGTHSHHSQEGVRGGQRQRNKI